jgi:hypothetical protein
MEQNKLGHSFAWQGYNAGGLSSTSDSCRGSLVQMALIFDHVISLSYLFTIVPYILVMKIGKGLQYLNSVLHVSQL